MSDFAKLLVLLVASILSNNFIFSRFLGCCPFLGVSSKVETAAGMGLAVTFVMALASLFTWLVYNFILVPLGLEYLQTMSFILVIASLVQFVEMFLKKSSPSLYKSLGIYLPLITTNCAVLGSAIICAEDETFGLVKSTVFCFASAVGFALALLLFSSVREKLELAKIPVPLKGAAIALLTASILAMAFTGFSGLGG